MKRGFLISVGAYLGLWLVLEALFPAPSYAYLDPGTGNVLVYLAISLVGTVLYFVKNIVYAIMGRAKGERRPEKQLHHERILMFSEGRSYYYTFKPVIDAFLRRGVPFSYITMDVEDPALTIENDLMNSRYIGTGSAAFARAAGRRADIMLSTTPNIGTPGFPMPRPRRVTNLAHICHGVGDIAMYQKGSLDHYDAVLMVGDFMRLPGPALSGRAGRQSPQEGRPEHPARGAGGALVGQQGLPQHLRPQLPAGSGQGRL